MCELCKSFLKLCNKFFDLERELCLFLLSKQMKKNSIAQTSFLISNVFFENLLARI